MLLDKLLYLLYNASYCIKYGVCYSWCVKCYCTSYLSWHVNHIGDNSFTLHHQLCVMYSKVIW